MSPNRNDPSSPREHVHRGAGGGEQHLHEHAVGVQHNPALVYQWSRNNPQSIIGTSARGEKRFRSEKVSDIAIGILIAIENLGFRI